MRLGLNDPAAEDPELQVEVAGFEKDNNHASGFVHWYHAALKDDLFLARSTGFDRNDRVGTGKHSPGDVAVSDNHNSSPVEIQM